MREGLTRREPLASGRQPDNNEIKRQFICTLGQNMCEINEFIEKKKEIVENSRNSKCNVFIPIYKL